MALKDTDLTGVQKASEGLVAAGDLFDWSWDDRFGAALTTFQAANEEKVRAALATTLPVRHDATTIKEASKLASQIAEAFGGLRGGQELLFSTDGEAPLMVGAWWPWGNGATISLRVKVIALGLDDGDKLALMDTFRGWYGI